MSQPTSTSTGTTKPPTTIKRKSSSPQPATKQKLKLSCDTCAKLKVGCPKQQPECERCVSKGRRCTYSSANRYGKRKRDKDRDAEKSLPSPPEHLTWQTPLSVSDLGRKDSSCFQPRTLPNDMALVERVDVEPSPYTTHHATPKMGQPTPSCVSSALSEGFWPSANDVLPSIEPCDPLDAPHPYQEVSMYQASHMYYPPYESPSSWPHFTASEMQMESPAAYSNEPSAFSPRDTDPFSIQEVETAIKFDMTDNNHSRSHNPSHVHNDTMNIHDVSPSQLHSQTSQDGCFSRICHLFESLKRPSSSACMFEPRENSTSSSSFSQDDSIETTLGKTSHAVEQAAAIMKCSCRSSSSVRCALTLVLFEIISWYESIVKEVNSDSGLSTPMSVMSNFSSYSSGSTISPGYSSDEGYISGNVSQASKSPASSAHGSRNNSISACGNGNVFVPTMTIGTMKIDDQDAKNMLAQLIVSRIHRVRGMVQELAQEGHVGTTGARGSVSGSPSLSGVATMATMNGSAMSTMDSFDGFLKMQDLH